MQLGDRADRSVELTTRLYLMTQLRKITVRVHKDKVLPLPLPSQCPVAITVLFWLAPNAKNFKTEIFHRSNNNPTTVYFKSCL
jgi:hypothetical protein